jgi:hypothetical protein
MSLENYSAILQKRVLDTHKNLRIFFSELLIREEKPSFVTQKLGTNF